MGGNKKKPTQSNALHKSQDDKNPKKEDIKKLLHLLKPQQKQKLSVLIRRKSRNANLLDSMKAITIHAIRKNIGCKNISGKQFCKKASRIKI